MVHTYQITGMTCSSCEAKVKSALLMTDGITAAEVSKAENSAVVAMSRHIPLSDLQKVLGDKYRITAVQHNEMAEQGIAWVTAYKPILLIFLYITAVTLLIQAGNHHFNRMQWMQHFMAGFFLVFSFFKFLNLRAFAESYAMYDVLARRIPAWGYIYAFLELALGIAYLVNFNPVLTSAAAFFIMLASIIGVLQAVFNKKQIKCACLGAVFNLPMSTVTIAEDGLMIIMSGAMLVMA